MDQAKKILEKMSLDEKTMLLSQGLIEQNDLTPYGLKSFYVADGPSGIRKREEISHSNIPLVCFPSVSTYSCSWDKGLMRKIGYYLGQEAKTEGIHVLFGPGCNIKRSPLGGRNFEYYSEDPILTGELATEYVKGIQETGIGACVKHFAANNQETRRMSVDELIDERTLHEIYLKAFEKPVREGKPYMVMTGYNKINGEYCANNKKILKEVLRRDWEYQGNVITDCVAAHDLAEGLKNGLNLQLSSETKERLAEEVRELMAAGRITEKDVDAAVENTINLLLKCGKISGTEVYDPEEHHRFSAEVAAESMVLLKNENAVLPIQKTDSVCVVGKMAEDLRFQGAGSAHVDPYQVSQIYEEMRKYNPQIIYRKGYDEEVEESWEEVKKAVKKADKVVLCMGLPEVYESEGYDRKHMKLPKCQEDLLKKISEVNPHIIVVLLHGAPVEMPWVEQAEGILDAGLPGEAGGEAIRKLLFGEVNPSGKLTETYPERLENTPSYLNFPGKGNKVTYAEGIYVGYRYYDKRKMKVRFPFGYGLSYTEFVYRNLEVEKQKNGTIKVSLKVKNTGERSGKEIVQLYIKKPGVRYDCPERELADFEKISLASGEEKEVIFSLDPEIFQVYDEHFGTWVTEGGEYGIEIGTSSREIRMKEYIQLNSCGKEERIESDTTLEDIIYYFGKGEVLKQLLSEYLVSAHILELCFSENRTMRAMQLSNTMETLQRSDSMITEKVIHDLLEKLNL
ncbi:MAG: glycoside hydrolase family 3 C-terminal domain-containing protein [Bacillota bacterium]|nr:glycoside hydrolase family 3 C-terminal domain-containing protein [Bacillota bacterium]